MKISTLSSKNQTTLSADFVKQLGLAPGMRLKQWVEGNRIVIEPVGDVATAFGSLKPRRKFRSIAEEEEAIEDAIAQAGVESLKRQ
jgi:hypothetical protein